MFLEFTECARRNAKSRPAKTSISRRLTSLNQRRGVLDGTSGLQRPDVVEPAVTALSGPGKDLMVGLVHLVLQAASVFSLLLVGPRRTQRKAVRAFLECAAAQSKQTGNRQSTIALLWKRLDSRMSR